jgi:site-specific recombinase XerD
MAFSTTFVLKHPKGDSPSLIYLIIRFNQHSLDENGKKKYFQLKYSIGDKWIPKHWSIKKHRGINKQGFPDPTELNARLQNIETAAKDIYRRFINDGIKITADKIRSELAQRADLFPDLQRRPTKSNVIDSTPLSLIEFYEKHLKEVKFIRKRGMPFPISDRTRKKYATTLRHLKDFELVRKKVITFDEIEQDFYLEFVDYLRNHATKLPTEKNPEPGPIIMTENTVGKHIGMLKLIMNAAGKAGVGSLGKYNSKDFVKPNEEVGKIYLTENELLKIYKLDLSKINYLNKVRDLFLIGCYTCLRFSDFNNLKKENIYKNDQGTFLKVNTMKTGEIVVIPIHWIVLSILEKYNYELPKGNSNQKMNDYLKELGLKAGIADPVSIKKIEGGVPVIRTSQKYKLITTHTARRSGATNMFLAGIPAISIMKITGHKTESAFMRYIQMSQEDNANLLLKHPFFSTPKID